MKENKIEKLILDLSNRWECTPQEAVDRLNSMNESEINKLINSMTKKFQMGGLFPRPSRRPDISNPVRPEDGIAAARSMGYSDEQINNWRDQMHAGYSSNGYTGEDLNRMIYQSMIDVAKSRNNSDKILMRPSMQRIPEAPVTNSDPQYFNGPRNFKFENGGFIDCLRNGGSVEKCKCGCDKIAKAEDGKKVRRTDMPGYAYTLSDGTDVLTQDAVGIQPLPGSNYSIAGSSPEYETQRTTLTDKSGNVAGYNYNVYVNDGDHFGPINRYTTKRMWYRPSTWLRTVLTPEAAAEKQAAYDANKLKCGGSLPKKKKNYLKKK